MAKRMTDRAPLRATEPATPMWRLRLHGAAHVERPGGQRVALERRAAAVLALAAIEPGVPRERVARWLWPDSTDPRRNLRQQLLRFRQQFGRPLVDGEALLSLAVGVTLDDDDSQALLADHDYDDCDDFVDWLQTHNRALEARFGHALRDALAQAEQSGDLDSMLRQAERWRQREPFSEAAHHALMRAHYLRGEAAAGLAVHDDLLVSLARTRGGSPGADTQALARSLREVRLPAHRVPTTVPHSLLRPPHLVGRQREQAAVAAAWASTAVVWLLGEPGLGKSRLIDELLRAEPPGTVLHAQARPGDSGVPYSTLARLLRGCLSERADVLDPPRRQQLSRVLPELTPSVPLPADGQRLLLQGAVQHLLAQADVALVALDDLHFADDASVQMLGALIGAGAPGPRRWLLAQRPAEANTAANALRDGLEDEHAVTPLPLTPLDEAAMVELVDSLGLPGLDGSALAAQLVRHTGGNPLYALETLKAHLLQPGSGGRMPQPASVGALIERRLRQLSPPALALARVAALAGTDFDIELAEAVLGSSALALAEPWAELESAQVLREQQFAHDLVFEATLRTVPAAVAARLHAQLAEHLEGRGAEPAHIAAHWLAARQGLKAVPWLVTAGERALARFQRLAAGEHHQTAGRELLAAGQRDAAFVQFYRSAEAWAELSDLPRLEGLRDQLLALAETDSQWARAHLAAARVHDYQGDYEALHQAGERVLHHALLGNDRELQAQGLTCMQSAMFYQGRGGSVLPLLEQERALRESLGEAGAVVRCDYNRGVCLISMGLLPEAHAALAAAVDGFDRLGDREMLVHALRELAGATAQRGLAAEALEGLRRAQALLQTLELGEEDWSHITVQLSRVLRRTAAPAQALRVLDAFDARFGAEQAGMRTRVHLERGELMLELGRSHAAWQALARAGQADASDLAHAARMRVLRLQLQAVGAAPPAAGPAPDLSALSHRSLQLALARAAALELPSAERAATFGRLAAEAQDSGFVADALGLRADWVTALLDDGQVTAAAHEAHGLATAMAGATPAQYPPQCWWAVHRALADTAPPAARAALGHALAWIASAVDDGLPSEFVPSFLQRNPTNRLVLAAALRHQALAPHANRLAALASADA